MMIRILIVGVVFSVVVCGIALGGGSDEFSYKEYGEVLALVVDDDGMVDYRGLQKNQVLLDEFISSLVVLPQAQFKEWSEREKIAFWINAYNALTLKAVVDAYPVESIREINGVWDKMKFHVMDRKLTLNGIEHDILRKKFNEPRIHMAINCASFSCPPLRNEPFTGERLDGQLEEQSRWFLSIKDNFKIDQEKRTIYLSKIFDWFGKDFIAAYGEGKTYAAYGKTERSVLNFIAAHVSPELMTGVASKKYKVKHLDYNWSLNERRLERE